MGKQKNKESSKYKGRKEPVDYGVTESQFYRILEKVSQPVKKPESDSEIAQT